MKKRIIILVSLMMAMLPFTSMQINAAKVNVEMNVGYDDPTYGQGDPHRGPIIPVVGIEDYTLTFTTPCYGYTLVLVDEDDTVVYTSLIVSDTVNLPSTLSGEYQLRLIPNDGNIYFYGYVSF